MYKLKTLKGSKVWYSKYGVGKQMGSKIYVHKKYVHLVIPCDIINAAKDIMDEFEPDFKYNCVCWDKNNQNIVRFDEVPGFDTEREPVVGKMCYVNLDTFPTTMENKYGYSPQIFHHKWLWVIDDYKGFDVEVAWKWSKTWLQKITNPSGYKNKWEQELKEKGLA